MSLQEKQEALEKQDKLERLESPLKQSMKFADRFQRLLTSEHQWDVDIVAGKSPLQITYKAHRLILAAGSDVFRAMFYGPLQSSAQSIDLPDMDPDAFGSVLKYFYTGSLVLEEVEEACHILYAAKKYLLNELIEQCRAFLKKEINADTVCGVYDFVHRFEGEDDLVSACVEVLQRSTWGVLNSDSFLTASTDLVQKLVSLEGLNIDSEAELIKAVFSWSQVECSRLEWADTRANKLKILKLILPKIRFLSLTSDEFSSLRQEIDVFEPAEYCAILSFILNPVPVYVSLCRDQRRKFDDEPEEYELGI